MDFLQQFKAARRVSTPLINIRTFDAKSTTAAILDALNGKKNETPILIWDAINGLVPLNGHPTKPTPSQMTMTTILGNNDQGMTIPIQETLRMLANDEIQDVIVFISNAHLFWKQNGAAEPVTVQGIWNLRDTYKANGNMLILLSTPGAILPDELQSDVLVLDEPLPTLAQLQKTVRDTFEYAQVPAPSEETLNKSTDALIGLPAFPAEQATAMCLDIDRTKKDKPVGNLGIDNLWDRKRQIINQTPGLSVYTGKEKLEDIGGVASAKAFFRAIMEGKYAPSVIIFIDEIEKAFAGTGTDMSGTKTELTGSMLSWMQDKDIQGTISIGIPGVSKSALAKALGGTYGKPVINFDVAGMQGSLVGESGARLRAAQKTVEAISGGGSVLAIATCNGIAALPPELRRRFSLAQFFFDAPDVAEKEAIWAIHRKKYGVVSDEPNPADKGWTGAEIESCCKKARMLSWKLEQAATYIVPVTVSAADIIAKTRQDASGRYLSASKPGIYHHSETLEAKAAPLAPVFSDPANAGRKMRD